MIVALLHRGRESGLPGAYQICLLKRLDEGSLAWEVQAENMLPPRNTKCHLIM